MATAKAPVPGTSGMLAISTAPELVDLTPSDTDYAAVCLEMQNTIKEHADGGMFEILVSDWLITNHVT